jgi:O-antigen/teichoic acid export membrane protein
MSARSLNGTSLVERAFGRDPGGEASARGGRSLSMLKSSLALIVGKVATMGLGFLFWLVAARTFEVSEVGLAAGAVSAVMLCTQLALVGIGSSLIVHYPRHKHDPDVLLDTAFSVVAVSSVIAAAIFFAIAASAFHALSVVATDPVFALAFAGMSVLGTIGILLDQVSTVLRRGDQMFVRALLFGLANIALLAPVAVWSSAGGAVWIFATWVGAAAAAVVLGAVQLWRTPLRYRYRPRLRWHVAWPLLRVGVPNHWLTLTERAPGLILPIIVTELVSPAANAAWYAAWMMAWVLYIIPIQVGMTLFAEAANKTASLTKLIRHGLRSSLVLGVAGATVVALFAPQLLSILGPRYAAAGSTPLRILVLAVVPLAFIQAYFVVCRSTGRLKEGVATGVIGALASIGGAALAALTTGLVGIAVVWVVIQVLVSVWAVWRLSRLSRASRRIDPVAVDRSSSEAEPLPAGIPGRGT